MSQNCPCMSPHIYKQVASSNNHHEQDKDKTNRDGGVDNLDVRLLDEDLARLEAELLDLLLRDGLAPQQLLDLAASTTVSVGTMYVVSCFSSLWCCSCATRTYLSRSLGILSFCQGFTKAEAEAKSSHDTTQCGEGSKSCLWHQGPTVREKVDRVGRRRRRRGRRRV